MKNKTLIELENYISTEIVGMESIVRQLLIAFLCEGHVLVEGVPGLAKTTIIKNFANALGLSFSRIQFSPDLLPADITGTEIFNQQTSTFSTRKGPLFANTVMADEINRAPSKVQSALLEAMEEKQVTIADQTYILPRPYMVLATQNPIEHEGTYLLPEAQLDRFIMKVLVDYPKQEDEILIVKKKLASQETAPKKISLQQEEIEELIEASKKVYIDDMLLQYIVSIVDATRNPQKVQMDPQSIICGASPRASIFLAKAARAHAFLRGESYVNSDDIKEIAPAVLRHRLQLSYETQAEEITTDHFIAQLLSSIESP